MEKEVKTSKKLKIVLVIVAVLLVLVAAVLFWFFNRKFDVTFKINDNEKYTIQVKYNKNIKEEDIKNKDELGENFIDWYEVISGENDSDVLAKDAFNFGTKIKEDKTLKAVYKAEQKEEEEEKEIETIKITFDSKGGSKINSVTMNAGAKLSFPKNPTRNGYTFVSWTLANGKEVKNNTAFKENTTLYAKWNKVEEPKKEEPKEETISLTLSRNVIHRNGNKTANAIARVENATGNVTYSIDSNACVTIDQNTGLVTAKDVPEGSGTKIKFWLQTCATDGSTVTITAKLPSGKSASATLAIEKDLKLKASLGNAAQKQDVTQDKQNFDANRDKEFSIDANQTVTWSVKPEGSNCVTTGSNNVKSANYDGTILAKCNGTSSWERTLVTATTDANQKLSVYYNQVVN